MDSSTAIAVRNYEAVRRAQKRYYEKKMNEKGPRRPRGRPAKIPVADPPSENPV